MFCSELADILEVVSIESFGDAFWLKHSAGSITIDVCLKPLLEIARGILWSECDERRPCSSSACLTSLLEAAVRFFVASDDWTSLSSRSIVLMSDVKLFLFH